MPDLFRGDPVPADALSNPDSNFNMTAWRARHPQSQVEQIIESAISTLRTTFNSSRIGGTVRIPFDQHLIPILTSDSGLLLWW